jgi:hypothetical protein
LITPVGSSKVVQSFGPGQTCAYCHGFAKIPPLIRSRNGRMYMNPDFESVGMFTVRAEPFGITIPAGQSHDLAMTVPAEEADLGDLLINELHGAFAPAGTRDVTIEILSTQTTRTFQNAPIWNTLILGNSQLSCCLPCCTLVQATASLSLRVTNNDSVPVSVSITGRGKRFLTRNEEMRARMLMYWNSIPSFPFFLTFDNQEVTIPALATVTGFMTVPGTGDFEVKAARCEVRPSPPGGPNPDPDVVLVTLTEQVGRELQSDPLPLGSFVATPTLAIAGFPGGLYRAASACSCPLVSQLLKRNTRLRVTMQNTGAVAVTVRLVFPGCFHEVSECPPGRSMDRIRSLEPTIGPLLISQRDYCPPEEQVTAPQPEPAYQAPAPALAPVAHRHVPVAMFRPSGKYYGPGSTGSLPYDQSFARDAEGHVWVVIRDPRTNAYVRDAVRGEWPSWVDTAIMPGLNGLGASPRQQLAPAQRAMAEHARQRTAAITARAAHPGQVAQQGQAYWDPIMREWRTA